MNDHSLRPFLMAILTVVMVTALAFPQATSPEIQAALDTRDYPKAIELLQAAIAKDVSYHWNYHLLGKVYYELDRFADAREQLELALDKRSGDYDALYLLAKCQLQLGDTEEAANSIDRGLKKAKNLVPHFHNAAGLLAMALEDYAAADVAFRRALAESESAEAKKISNLENSPHSPEDRQRLMDQARAEYCGLNAEFHTNLGDANFYQDVPSLAVAEYEKALEVDTGSLEVYFHWAEACLAMRDYTCALEKLRVVLAKDSTHAEAWRRAGGIYYKAARSSRSREERTQFFADAIGSYERFVELSGAAPDSSNVRVYFETAMAYSSIGRYEEAAAYYEHVLGIPFVPKDIYFNYGKALFWAKDYDRSADLLLQHIEWAGQQDEEYTTNIRDHELYRLLGDSYFYRDPKVFHSAIKYYVKSVEANPEQERLMQNIAVAYHSTKSYGQAIEYYDKRIAMGIDSSTANIYKNAGYCALNIAGGQDDDEEELDFDDGLELEGEANLNGINPDLNYFEVAIGYLNSYLEFKPDDVRAVLLVANTYLYQLSDCANGISYFERLLVLEPDNCVAKKSLGYAYFGHESCNKDYSKALTYLHSAYDCISAGEGPCSDFEVSKWIAQCYHLRAVDRGGNGTDDYKNAYDWYGKCLNCDPNDQECRKGQDDTRFEF